MGDLRTVCQLIAVNFPLRLPIQINLQICTRAHPHPWMAMAPLAVCLFWVHFHLYLDLESLSVWLSICKCRWAILHSSTTPPATPLSLSVCLFVCLFTCDTLCGTFKLLLPRYTCPTWHNRFLKLFRKPKTLKNTTHTHTTHTHSYTHTHTGRGRHTHALTHCSGDLKWHLWDLIIN